MLFIVFYLLGAAAVALWFFQRMPYLRPMRIKSLGIAMFISLAAIQGAGYLTHHMTPSAAVMVAWLAITYSLLVAIWWLNLLVLTTKNGGHLP